MLTQNAKKLEDGWICEELLSPLKEGLREEMYSAVAPGIVPLIPGMEGVFLEGTGTRRNGGTS